MIAYQRTPERSITLEGKGLHTGAPCRLTVNPAPVNHGISFKRTDIPESPEIPACLDSVVDLSRGTTLGSGDVRVHTIEHVMAALRACDIHNAVIDMDGPEPPVGDGSAKPYLDLLKSVRCREQGVPRPELIITTPVTYTDPVDNVIIKVFPAETFRVTFLVDYADHLTMGTRFYSLDSMEDFDQEIAPARTYSLLSEMKSVMQRGLGKGGTLDNNIVFIDREISEDELKELKTLFKVDHDIRLGNTGILDERPLRFPNEPVRHKILDLVGDLYLLGMPVRGHVMAFRSGHRNNVAFVKKLVEVYKPFIHTLKNPEPGAGLLGALMPDFTPVPQGWRVMKEKDQVRSVFDPVEYQGRYLDKGLIFRLLGLSAASLLLYDKVHTIRRIVFSGVRDLKFFKDIPRREYTFLSRIIHGETHEWTVSSRMMSGGNEVICEGVFKLNIERDV
jgi:UDP-3-O-acyl N-acetylglucosamine deacetylase